jgi:DNA-binding NarL/FixJ family response regulator
MPRKRLLLADDHAVLLEGLRGLLEREFDVVATVEDGLGLIAAARRTKPEIIVLDISMPNLNGLDAARELHRILPRTKLIFLTMHSDPTYVKSAFRAGASGYVIKRRAFSELRQAIEAALKGQRFVTPFLPPDVLTDLLAETKDVVDLTTRQREILQLVAEGRTNKEIGSLLFLSIKTVEFHRSQIKQKLGLHTIAELTQYAIRHGIVQP